MIYGYLLKDNEPSDYECQCDHERRVVEEIKKQVNGLLMAAARMMKEKDEIIKEQKEEIRRLKNQLNKESD